MKTLLITILCAFSSVVVVAQQTIDTKDVQIAKQKIQIGTDTARYFTLIKTVLNDAVLHKHVPTAKAVYDFVQTLLVTATVAASADAAKIRLSNTNSLGVTLQGQDGITLDPVTSAQINIALKDASVPPEKLAPSGATTGQVLSWSGSAWVPTNASGVTKTYEEFDALSGTTITTSNTIPATERNWRINLYRDGVRLRYLKDYSISGSVFTLYVTATSENFTLIIEN